MRTIQRHRWGLWSIALTFLLLSGLAAGLTLSPAVQKGLVWLQAQVQSDGSLQNEAGSIAHAQQQRAEILGTLRVLATPPAGLQAAVTGVSQSSTELLARQAIEARAAGQDLKPLLSLLAQRRNADAGYGGDIGYTSNPLDTAWALLALDTGDTGALDSVQYLLQQQQANGAFQVGGRDDLYTSAYALQALARFASRFDSTAPIAKLSAYLTAQQGTDGSWAGSAYLSAVVYQALHDFIPQEPTASNLATFFTLNQGAEGSWGQDSYVTALVLRALQLTQVVPAQNTQSAIKGKLVDAQTGAPLSGVSAVLAGAGSASMNSDGGGSFQFTGLQTGNYTITLSLNGYSGIKYTVSLPASHTTDLGVIQLAKSQAGNGSIRGVVTDAASKAPLSGVVIQAAGLVAITDASGSYQLGNVPVGSVTISASKTGYYGESGSADLPAGGTLQFSPAMTVYVVPTGAPTPTPVVVPPTTPPTVIPSTRPVPTATPTPVTLPTPGPVDQIMPVPPFNNDRWNLIRDFSTTDNPNGPWQFGWKDDLTSPFRLYTAFAVTQTGPAWYTGITLPGQRSGYEPSIWKNATPNMYYGISPGWTSIHPGPQAQPATVRWVAPEDLHVTATGLFGAGDRAALDYLIEHNGQNLFRVSQSTFNASFNVTLDVKAGDVLDFMVTGGFVWGNTPIDIHINAPYPAPTQARGTVVDDATGLPIANAGIIFTDATGGQSLLTDASGAFVVKPVKADASGQVQIKVLAEGYVGVELGAALNGNDTDVGTIRLRKAQNDPGTPDLAIGISALTDKTAYGANASAILQAQVSNHGGSDQAVNVRLLLQTATGQPVAAFPIRVATAGQGGVLSVLAPWNTGSTQPGTYKLIAQLLTNNGAISQQASTTFDIVADAGTIGALGGRISTDKTSYAATDVVQLTERVQNQSANSEFDALTVTTVVTNPDGSVRFTQQQPLSLLLAGQFQDYGYNVGLSNAVAGTYTATLTVQDAGGAVLAQQSTSFNVLPSSSTGSGVTGTLTVASQINQGEQALFSLGVTNAGNSALSNLPLTVRVIDPATGTLYATLAQTANVAAGQSIAPSASWTASAPAGSKLLAVLSATFGGKDITLAQAPFTVVVPAIKLDAQAQLDNGNRVLVWYSCGNTWWGSNSPLLANQPCFNTRKQQLQNLLNAQDVRYQLTASEADFQQQLRSGLYNQYWLLGEIDHVKSSTLLELREMVNRGNTLVLDANALALGNSDLAAVAGASFGGVFSTANQTVTLKSGLFQAGTVASSGQPACLIAGSGQVQATLPGGTLASNSGCPTSGTRPAIVTNNYGKGQSVLFAYDLLDSLTAGGTAGNAAFATAQGSLVNALPLAYPVGDLVPAKISVANQAAAVTLDILSMWVNGSQLLYSSPTATATASNADWRGLALPQGATQRVQLGFTAAAPIGQQALNTALSTQGQNGSWVSYGNLPLVYQVTDLNTLLLNAGSSLQAQAAGSGDVANLGTAKADLGRADSEARAGQYCPALLDTLGSIEALRKLATDYTASRQSLDELLHELMRRANGCGVPALMDKAVLTLMDDGGFNGTMVAIDAPYGGMLNKLPILAGGVVTATSLDGQISSAPYKAGQPATLHGAQAIVQGNANVSANGDRFFLEYFGYTKDQIKQKAYRINGSQFANEALAGNLNGGKGHFVWVDGDAVVNYPLGNIGFSAVNQQGVVIIVNGKLTLNAGATFYGVLYGIGDSNGNWAFNSGAPVMLNGLMAVEGNLNMNASLHLVDAPDYYNGLLRP
ncbi:Carboxypeptidase regulatory-like domain-containing protein [Andreprevotia lacus DSM 23236]|jgi:hypothetical protein|uniref:Carboxypeptidase regulatory-like domain-containing protein n=1 Tax=Andreprevotia lacus DSM 23236 TaxID=1121001 RepID=A0A1W1WY25_9NEIS|nr:carboxypeptidase regulatory-like domain-containing protein [Andreprevotia lacus]SMC16636.1 Carboxypeptidase regulatory-like domain-containing protein [Andreprevotia lacus DSM 23236]